MDIDRLIQLFSPVGRTLPRVMESNSSPRSKAGYARHPPACSSWRRRYFKTRGTKERQRDRRIEKETERQRWREKERERKREKERERERKREKERDTAITRLPSM